MSSGLPARFIGEFAAITSTGAGRSPARSIGVSMKPGGTLFTVMPLAANSAAIALVNAMTPPFDAAYGTMRAAPVWALDDDTFTMRPHFASSMSVSSACEQVHMLLRLTLMILSQRSSLTSRNERKSVMPALFTRMRTGPNFDRTAAAAASTSARFDTSTLHAIARKPSALSAAAAACAPASLMSQMAIALPFCARRRAHASPMPDAAPVTTAVWFCGLLMRCLRRCSAGSGGREAREFLGTHRPVHGQAQQLGGEALRELLALGGRARLRAGEDRPQERADQHHHVEHVAI